MCSDTTSAGGFISATATTRRVAARLRLKLLERECEQRHDTARGLLLEERAASHQANLGRFPSRLAYAYLTISAAADQ